MLNKFSRFILTASSVSPVCGTVAFLVWVKREPNTWDLLEHLSSWELHQDEKLFLISLMLFIFSIILFPIVFHYAKKEERWKHPREIRIASVKSKNAEMTSYLLGYLFPLIAGGDLFSNIEIALFFYVIMFFAVWFSDSYGFNPILALFKYKFYEAESEIGIGLTLISKGPIHNLDKDMSMVQLTDYAYMQVENKEIS